MRATRKTETESKCAVVNRDRKNGFEDRKPEVEYANGAEEVTAKLGEMWELRIANAAMLEG